MSGLVFRDEKDPEEALASCKGNPAAVSAATIALWLAQLFPSFGDHSPLCSEEIKAVII